MKENPKNFKIVRILRPLKTSIKILYKIQSLQLQKTSQKLLKEIHNKGETFKGSGHNPLKWVKTLFKNIHYKKVRTAFATKRSAKINLQKKKKNSNIRLRPLKMFAKILFKKLHASKLRKWI